jgi:RNA polymerase subunit RPABC4/transcription elongation factor Spt4
MIVVKCNKCKANIPDGATFCPSCGTPKSEQQATYNYQPQQIMNRGSMSSVESSPLENVFDMVFSKTAIIIGVFVGILLVWIGLVIIIFASGSYKPAALIASIGFAGIGSLLIGGGVWNNRIDKFVRLAMVLIGVWAIVQTMSVLSSSAASLFG